jgi:glyoxylase-like metal-dependent hydrolase (beta-lactamase superfamily II)
MQIKRFHIGALWTNCYVLWSETGDAIIADPGGPTGEVQSFIAERKLRVSKILLTHGHSDHIMGVGELRGISSGGVSIHAEDADCLTNPSRNLSEAMGHSASFASADSTLTDGDVLEIGDMSIRVIFTPGHTRGGCCFYASEGDDALLLSGDTLFARSVGRTDLPGGDDAVLAESLKKLEEFPDSLRVYPGHGPDTTLGEERRLNPFWPR